MDKDLLIKLLTEKNKGTNKMTFNELSKLTGYHTKSLIRINKVLKEKGEGVVKIHGNVGRKRSNSLSDVEFIIEQKKICTDMSFLKFCEYYNKQVSNPNSKFKPRSYSYIYNVLIKSGIMSHLGHNSKKSEISSIEDTKSLLILKDTEMRLADSNGYITLFLAFDAVSNQIIHMHLSQKDNKANYYLMLKEIVTTFGIPENIYAHGLTVFRAPKSNITQFHRMCSEFNISIFLNHDSKLQKIISAVEKDVLKDLPSLLSMKKFSSIKQINYFVKTEYIPSFNKARAEINEKSIFKAYENVAFDNILCEKYKRKIVWQGSINNVQFRNVLYHIEGIETTLMRGTDVLVYLYFDGAVKVCYEGNLYNMNIIRKLHSVKGIVKK